MSKRPSLPEYIEKYSKLNLVAHEQERQAREQHASDDREWLERENARLIAIENAALSVASSARSIGNGKVCVDKSAMDRLDAALEGREHICCSCGLRINAAGLGHAF